MNRRLTNSIWWIIGTFFCILNLATGADRMAWGVITVIFAVNSVRQFLLYRKEKENDNG